LKKSSLPSLAANESVIVKLPLALLTRSSGTSVNFEPLIGRLPLCGRDYQQGGICSGKINLIDATPSLSATEKADAEAAAGSLLADLERRQDDVLAQLDDLDRRVSELLRGLGVTLIEDSESIHFVDDNQDDADTSASPQSEPVAAAGDERISDFADREETIGFSKLPQSDSAGRVAKRAKITRNDAAAWDQDRRAA